MYQLEHHQKYIDNSVVMLDVAQLGNSSVIKFGGYDFGPFHHELSVILNTTFDGQWIVSSVGF